LGSPFQRAGAAYAIWSECRTYGGEYGSGFSIGAMERGREERGRSGGRIV